MNTAKRISNYKKEFKLINQKTVKYKQNGFDTTIKIKQNTNRRNLQIVY